MRPLSKLGNSLCQKPQLRVSLGNQERMRHARDNRSVHLKKSLRLIVGPGMHGVIASVGHRE